MNSPLESQIKWSPTADALVPWRARVKDATWKLRVNDFPEEHLYTLLINDREVQSFDDWPTAWQKQAPKRNSIKRPVSSPQIKLGKLKSTTKRRTTFRETEHTTPA